MSSIWWKRALIMFSTVMATASSAYAGSYHSNVIKIIVPTTPGTPPDIISRIIANELTETDG